MNTVASAGAAIAFDGVAKSFDGGRSYVVRDVALEVNRGELLVLLGESGCGKTTTLKMVNRLAEPTRGRVFLEGQDVAGMDPVALRRGIGYAFQGVGLFPHLTVAENVAVVPRLLGWPIDRTQRRVDELLELLQLSPREFRDRKPDSLSGGQRQRVGLARALAAFPRVMLLDEPFGALDPLTRDAIQREFRLLHRRLGLTTILVTHDMAEALLLADRVAVMRRGEVVQVGTPAELASRPADAYVDLLIGTPRRQAAELAGLGEAPARTVEPGRVA